MFVVFVGSVLTTGALRPGAAGQGRGARPGSSWPSPLWLWFTVLFANFAEAMAEGRGKAQADTLRKARARHPGARGSPTPTRDAASMRVASADLRKGDVVLVEAGEFIPGDGEVIEGVASVDESAITGESAPVIRESGGDRSAVTGGTRVLSDWLIVRVTANPGESFLDRMIAMVEGAKRQKTPERDRAEHPARGADDHLPGRLRHAAAVLASTASRRPGRATPVTHHGAGRAARLPDPDDHRRAALGHRHRRDGPPDPGQRASPCPAARSRPPATWTCCSSTRPARSRWATGRRRSSSRRRACTCRSWPTRRSSPRWPTRRPRAAASSCSPRRSTASAAATSIALGATFVPFTAQTRMSGVDLDGRADPQGRGRRHRGATSGRLGGEFPADVQETVRRHRPRGRHAAGRRGRRAGAGRHPSQGHRQGRHQGAVRSNCAAWASRR